MYFWKENILNGVYTLDVTTTEVITHTSTRIAPVLLCNSFKIGLALS